jgi:Ni/Fe-hydrogenase subunit HybB-like protein
VHRLQLLRVGLPGRKRCARRYNSAIAPGVGAFTFSAAVYVFRIKRLEPLARPAVFVDFLGYASAMLALFLDIGRPDRFWHPLVFWQQFSIWPDP